MNVKSIIITAVVAVISTIFCIIVSAPFVASIFFVIILVIVGVASAATSGNQNSDRSTQIKEKLIEVTEFIRGDINLLKPLNVTKDDETGEIEKNINIIISTIANAKDGDVRVYGEMA